MTERGDQGSPNTLVLLCSSWCWKWFHAIQSSSWNDELYLIPHRHRCIMMMSARVCATTAMFEHLRTFLTITYRRRALTLLVALCVDSIGRCAGVQLSRTRIWAEMSSPWYLSHNHTTYQIPPPPTDEGCSHLSSLVSSYLSKTSNYVGSSKGQRTRTANQSSKDESGDCDWNTYLIWLSHVCWRAAALLW